MISNSSTRTHRLEGHLLNSLLLPPEYNHSVSGVFLKLLASCVRRHAPKAEEPGEAEEERAKRNAGNDCRQEPDRDLRAKEVRDLIRRMSFENPFWGATKIHGELLKLGIQVAQSKQGSTSRAFATMTRASSRRRRRWLSRNGADVR